VAAAKTHRRNVAAAWRRQLKAAWRESEEAAWRNRDIKRSGIVSAAAIIMAMQKSKYQAY